MYKTRPSHSGHSGFVTWSLDHTSIFAIVLGDLVVQKANKGKPCRVSPSALVYMIEAFSRNFAWSGGSDTWSSSLASELEIGSDLGSGDGYPWKIADARSGSADTTQYLTENDEKKTLVNMSSMAVSAKAFNLSRSPLSR
ncbi:hypothetical protein KCV07_g541, partial [Aureobasidium melanogenum]